MTNQELHLKEYIRLPGNDVHFSEFLNPYDTEVKEPIIANLYFTILSDDSIKLIRREFVELNRIDDVIASDIIHYLTTYPMTGCAVMLSNNPYRTTLNDKRVVLFDLEIRLDKSILSSDDIVRHYKTLF